MIYDLLVYNGKSIENLQKDRRPATTGAEVSRAYVGKFS